MLTTMLYVAGLYTALAAVSLACWGVGGLALQPGSAAATDDPWRAPMAIVAGLGVFICFFQWLAIGGVFNRATVGGLGALGLLAAALAGLRAWRRDRSGADAARLPWSLAERLALGLLVLAILPTVARPLGPPLAWDELMYHLPHARLWAQDGNLAVHPWLRYPWFPYNIDLLYAAALLFGSDVMPHLLNAGCGWLAGLLIYRLGRQHAGRVTGCLAAAFWFVLTRSEYGQAYVDMPMTLFVLAGAIGFLHWHQRRQAARPGARCWLITGCFCLGVAAGSKYQVLMALPLFALALALRDRRAGTWAIALAALLLPAIYWYARNAVQTGDPFAPIGGRLFGFSDWNPEDYRLQFFDLRNNGGWPHWLLWPALLSPLLPAVRRSAAGRAALWAGGYLLLVWALSSRYPRYLMLAYPVLALLAAAVWVAAGRVLLRQAPLARLARRLQARTYDHPQALPAWGLAAVGGLALLAIDLGLPRVAATETRREAILARQVSGYRTLARLRQLPPGKVYQMGLEDAVYYTAGQVHGDLFGPWRYRDYTSLAPAELHESLARQGISLLLIHAGRVPEVAARPGFSRYFESLHDEDGVSLYRLRDISP